MSHFCRVHQQLKQHVRRQTLIIHFQNGQLNRQTEIYHTERLFSSLTGKWQQKRKMCNILKYIFRNAVNIPVMRLVMSKKQTRRKTQRVIKEGWMVHYTDKNNMRKRTYWRLDTKSIVMFMDETTGRYCKEIPLCDILSIHSTTPKHGECAKAPSPHWFELKTVHCIYFVGNIFCWYDFY